MSDIKQSGIGNTQTQDNSNNSIEINTNIRNIYNQYIRTDNLSLAFDLTMKLDITKELIRDAFNNVSDMRLLTNRLIRQHSVENNTNLIKKSFKDYHRQTVLTADFHTKFKNILSRDSELINKYDNLVKNIDSITEQIISQQNPNNNKSGRYSLNFDDILLSCEELEVYLISLSNKPDS